VGARRPARGPLHAPALGVRCHRRAAAELRDDATAVLLEWKRNAETALLLQTVL